jgi:adenosylhomocysteine nucleosidase
MSNHYQTAVLISANQEWQAVLALFPRAACQPSPYGQWFQARLPGRDGEDVIFYHGGWGKISAAASTQYVIDRWQPGLLVNLGTCGGFEGCITRGEVLLVERTIVYDIIEQMGDFDQAIQAYSSQLDLSWLRQPYPHPVHRTLIVSADRDLVTAEIPGLQSRYGAVAGDWESGSIAWVAQHNGVRCLILRGVSDVAGQAGDEVYGNLDYFAEHAGAVMRQLVAALPAWLNCVG